MRINEFADLSSQSFDILKIHNDCNDRTIQSWIYANGPGLQNTIKPLLQSKSSAKIVELLKSKGMASYRNKSKTLIYMEKLLLAIKNDISVKWVPLALLACIPKSLNDKNEIISHIVKLSVVKNNTEIVEINAIKKLDAKLAKLLGIHAADGSISNYDGQIWIKDESHNNLIFVKSLFNETFGISPKIIRLKNVNAWGLYVNNKIIQRYFVEFFGLKKGYKTDSVKMPKIIKESSMEIKNAFVSGVLMSDGSVGFDGKIRLNCKSKDLVEDVHSVLLENGLRVSGIRNSIHGGKSTWYFSAPAPVKMSYSEKLKWLGFFDINSEKWYKIKETIFGCFEGKTDSSKDALELFAHTYTGGSNSKIKLVDVIKVVENLGTVEQKQLSQILHMDISTISKYVKVLRNANILKVIQKKKSNGVGKGSSPFVYSFNKNIYEWKVPYRPVLNEVSA